MIFLNLILFLSIFSCKKNKATQATSKSFDYSSHIDSFIGHYVGMLYGVGYNQFPAKPVYDTVYFDTVTVSAYGNDSFRLIFSNNNALIYASIGLNGVIFFNYNNTNIYNYPFPIVNNQDSIIVQFYIKSNILMFKFSYFEGGSTSWYSGYNQTYTGNKIQWRNMNKYTIFI